MSSTRVTIKPALSSVNLDSVQWKLFLKLWVSSYNFFLISKKFPSIRFPIH